MKQVLAVAPNQAPYILLTEVDPTDIVVQVFNNDANILLKTEMGNKFGAFGFASITRRQIGRTLDWNTCSSSREEAIRRVVVEDRSTKLFVFESQTEFFEACIKNKWKFIH